MIEPLRAFSGRIHSSNSRWVTSEDNRSELDNFLFNIYFQDIGDSPCYGFSILYRNVLQRNWFEKNHDVFSEDVYLELYNALAMIAYDGKSLFSSSRNVKLTPIHEAFALNFGYSFHEYCRA